MQYEQIQFQNKKKLICASSKNKIAMLHTELAINYKLLQLVLLISFTVHTQILLAKPLSQYRFNFYSYVNESCLIIVA